MQNDLLQTARQQAEKSEPSVRAAALLRIARAESADVYRARNTLLQALNTVRELPDRVRNHLLNEARAVAAAASPDLLAEIPIDYYDGLRQFTSGNIVQVMLAHGHIDAAFDYLMHYDDATSFPSPWVGNVLHQLDPAGPDTENRRLKLLRHTFEMWNQCPSDLHFHHQRDHFVRLFGHHWKEFPAEEALALTRTLVTRAAEEPDIGGTFGYSDEIRFTSPRQNTLFQLLHVLRHLDPTLAQSLIDSNDQLALAARRYPNGMETMNEEAEAEVARRKAEGATCSGGFIFAGDPADFDRQCRLFDATSTSDFEPSIQDAAEKLHEDTAPETRNYAPKEYWPSTGAFRTLFYHAGKRLGTDAIPLLERIPDSDLRLFATIELAAALAGVPASSITQMKQPRPVDPRLSQNWRIISVPPPRSGTRASRMRSPDGRLIRCPKCFFEPSDDLRWSCKCGHRWNTFWTAGKCPACHFQWEVTGCPHCGEMSQHRSWYESEP